MLRYVSINHNVSDLDECATGTHNCEQICCNTISNWTCDCNPGYSLHSDGRTCEGSVIDY